MTGAMPPAATSLASDPAPRRSLRILAVGNLYQPRHPGGYEVVWDEAMRVARERGHRTRVLTTDHGTDRPGLPADPDIDRTLRWYWDLDRYVLPSLRLDERLRIERHNAARLRRQLADFQPDVLTWWSMGCMSLSLIEQVRRAGVPAVFVVHDDWLDYGFAHDQWLRTWRGPRRGRVAPIVERIVGIPTRVDVGRAGRFVFNSEYTLRHARQLGLTTEHASVIVPGIDESFLEPVEQATWSWRLAYIGRLDRQKGIDTAVAALAHLPADATLSIWGSGEERYEEELRTLAERLGVGERVRFAGFADRDRVRDAYAGADVVVFPVRWQEPFGLVPIEAMGVGRLVVSTARGGTAEFIRDEENALVFAVDDAAELAARIKRLAADPGLRQRLLRGGADTAAQFTAARFATRTVAAIEAGASSNGAGA